MSRKLLFTIGIGLSGLAAAGMVVQPVAAQVVVYDPTNYVQNILSATRALEQINNQILQLQHEAQMLQNMATNLKHLDVTAILKLNSDLAAINDLMTQAKGIAFTLSKTQAALKAQYPSSYSSATTSQQLTTDATTRWQSAMDAFQQTLLVQAQISETLQTDANTLNELVSASDGAEGDLQAQQAANQLLALTAKQQMQIATLMAAQYRAETLDAARKAQGEAAAKAATLKFIGSGTAYTAQ
jgi:P-type conjugative transfer protein TrbJ